MHLGFRCDAVFSACLKQRGRQRYPGLFMAGKSGLFLNIARLLGRFRSGRCGRIRIDACRSQEGMSTMGQYEYLCAAHPFYEKSIRQMENETGRGGLTSHNVQRRIFKVRQELFRPYPLLARGNHSHAAQLLVNTGNTPVDGDCLPVWQCLFFLIYKLVI